MSVFYKPPVLIICVQSIEDECFPLLKIYLFSYRALRVPRVCVGCHKRCPITYPLPLFCPNLSLVSCDHLLCPKMSCCLLSSLHLSNLVHSSRRHSSHCSLFLLLCPHIAVRQPYSSCPPPSAADLPLLSPKPPPMCIPCT